MLAAVKHYSGLEVGEAPEAFWLPWLGHWTGLGPQDMKHLLIARYVQAAEWVEAQTSG